MSSQRKIEANRRNSLKSTGPRTDAGKAVSSVNHASTGIYAESQIIVGESLSGLDQLARELLDHFHPDGPVERCLVDTIIHSEWLLRRLRRTETGIWNGYIEKHGQGNTLNDIGRAFQMQDRTFSRLQRRLDCLQRSYQSALKDLTRLQQDRAASTPAVSDSAPEPAVVSVGFDSAPVLVMPPAALPPAPAASVPSLPLLEPA